MQNNLNNWTAKISHDNALHPDTSEFPPIGLVFRNQPYEDSSNGSFRSYLSACSSIYSVEDNTYDLPPSDDRPIPQAWGHSASVPDVLNTTTATQSVSGISQDEYDRMACENQKLNRKIEELTSKMTSWEQQQPVNIPQPLDMQSIIAATTEAVLRQMLALQHSSQPLNNTHNNQKPHGGANNYTHPAIGLDISETMEHNTLNMSVDSELTQKPNNHP